MTLPNAEAAIIDPQKLIGYLLNSAHAEGRHKAAFFHRFGFTADRWPILADALPAHAERAEHVCEESSPFGRRFVVEGIITTPDGRTPRVRTVKFIRTDESAPRFVASYPLPPRRTDA